MADFKRKDARILAMQLVEMIDTMRREMAGQDATIQRQAAEIERLREEVGHYRTLYIELMDVYNNVWNQLEARRG